MATVAHSAGAGTGGARLAYYLRVLRVIAAVEFKIKYAGSALGYLWSLAKPLSYFAVLWFVFGRVFKTGIEDFPAYLLIGIVIYTFFVDAGGLALASVVNRGPLLRRLAFPPIIIPFSVVMTALMTFCVNAVAVAVFLAFSSVTPTLEWLLIPLLIVELLVFVLGIGLFLAAMFVRFKDIGPLWELSAQLLLFATPVMYPMTLFPTWAQVLAFLNPLVQVMQDIRFIILGEGAPHLIAADVLGGPAGHLLPIMIAILTFVIGLLVFRRDAPKFAERV